MADDSQIKSAGSQGSQSAKNTQGKASKGLSDGAPVIDLRALDNTPLAGNAGANSATLATPATKSTSKAAAPVTDDGQYVTSGNQKYAIPALVREKFPDLIQLIKETESMNDEERQYWFQILPIMTEDQIRKFRDILVNEKEQLSRLDKEYEGELKKLNEKHMIEWQQFQSNEKRKALVSAEKQANTAEQSEEEALLKRLSQI
jgi:hypothetical protein